MYDYNMHLSSRKIFKYKQMIYFEQSLFIETYIIGYQSQGESILFFIRTDDNISFAGLVDCFCLKDINKVKDILEENKVGKLDFICWTHPDLDHSKGLKDIIDNYASEKTYIWIPENVEEEECDIACSTVYRKGSDLPLKEVMEQYDKNSKLLLCTGKADKNEEKEKYGIIKIITNILDDEYSIEKEGNAGRWNISE